MYDQLSLAVLQRVLLSKNANSEDLSEMWTLLAFKKVAGAPQRLRHEKARKLYDTIRKRSNFAVRTLSNGNEQVKTLVRVDEILEGFPKHSYLHLIFTDALRTPGAGGYFDGNSTIYVKVPGKDLHDLMTALSQPRIKSILVHEITHYLDSVEKSLWLSSEYSGAENLSAYYTEPAELSAILSQVVASISSKTKLELRKNLRQVKGGSKSLDSMLFEIPEVEAWESFHFKGFFNNDAPITRRLASIDQKMVRQLGVHLDVKGQKEFLKKLYISLEDFRRKELLPIISQRLKSSPDIFELENDEDYFYRTSGPGKKGAKAWWSWLLSVQL